MADFSDLEGIPDPQRARATAESQPITENSPLVPYGPHPQGPFGPAPSTVPGTRGLHFFYPSQQSEPGTAYVHHDYVYRCRNQDNLTAAFAALAATQAHSDKTRQEREMLSSGPARAHSIGPAQVLAINDAVAAVCHHSNEDPQSPLLKDVQIRQEKPLRSPLHRQFDRVVPKSK